MRTTDTTERGLERLICTALTGHPCDPHAPDTLTEAPAPYGGAGWGVRRLAGPRPRALRGPGATGGLSARDQPRVAEVLAARQVLDAE